MHLITRTEELAEACAQLAKAPFVALDTEFMREQTFWPKLCLIQMAGEGTEVLVDSLAPSLDLKPFFDLMVNERVLKVFHSGRQDIEIVHHLAGVIPHPIFDTQVAAMVCGFGESVSYSMLVKRLLNRNLDKTSRFTDWSRRPLSDRQLVYALGDVEHLRDLYPLLKTPARPIGTRELAQRGNGGVDRSRNLRAPSRAGLEAAQDARQDGEGARRFDGARCLA
jgi:ribonuclease D